MPKKSFSVYRSDHLVVDNGDHLFIEIAGSHLACIVSKENRRSIAAFELFTFNEDEADNKEGLFTSITEQSKILSIPFPGCAIFLNNEFCLPVPIFQFNKEIAADYLRVVFGERMFSKILFEHIAIEPGIMNVFTIDEDWLSCLNKKFKATYHHTYSNIIQRVASKTDAFPQQFISVQFYHASMIVIVLNDGIFHLIQKYPYETPEDVLYYLLNIAQQLQLFSEQLTVQISGMIDLEFQLYRELIKHFKNVVVQKVDASALTELADEHNAHFFTPFFNLAL